ncbi:hypothetical protein LTR84_010305 [Exophiala bonariae]|uniref:Gamma-glutamylcyclotransferase AIG2-like domain-containing protein n=1 Tax=Exophiala bonariae TaxID=1690606 RepID=A0AAV9MWG2_9EURO|nr:hypothetical protein LTR84_010305 [Exophiala bonariae]
MDLKIPNAESYQVGWVCAVRIEYIVACELLDEEYGAPDLRSTDDNNIYTCGRMGDFNVVIACLPKGRYGLTSAATAAQDLRHSFPHITFGLMVGIGGGAPLINKDRDIRLGDVVVSTPSGRTGGVIHYEFGKTIQNKEFVPFGHLNAPPRVLLTAVQKLDTIHYRRGNRIQETILQMIQRNPRLKKDYSRPSPEMDILFKTSYLHEADSHLCVHCCSPISDNVVPRLSRTQDLLADQTDTIRIHYGLVASADRLMKDATVRDQLADAEGVLCFEMEAAGLMDSFPCLVIRGICDYSDTHKNDVWQGYAAATAAAYAKELLAVMPKRAVIQKHSTTGLWQEPADEQQDDLPGGWNFSGISKYSETQRSTGSSPGLLQRSAFGQENGSPQRAGDAVGSARKVEVKPPDKVPQFVFLGSGALIYTLRRIGFDRMDGLPLSFIMAVENRLDKVKIQTSYLGVRRDFYYHPPYFFAGSLMFPSTIRAISSGISLGYIVSTMAVATLRGYKRHAVTGSPWPAFSPSDDPRDEITGLVCFGINSSQRQRIHDFQGGMFDLRKAIIDIDSGNGDTLPCQAELYVWNQSPNKLIPTNLMKWSPDSMLKDDWIQDIFKETRNEEAVLEWEKMGRYRE